MASSSHVSWQTAFWSLVPLALNVMTQPSGRVCGWKGASRFYLRCSPVICAADWVAMSVRYLVYLVKARSNQQALRMTLDARFRDLDDDASSDEGFQALEKLTFVRWMLFILGTLPQAIKLVFLKGVPWTQAWGVMFLVPFVTLEIMIILQTGAEPANIVQSATTGSFRAIGSDGAVDNGNASTDQEAVEQSLQRLDSTCGTIGLTVHMCLLFEGFHQLLHLKVNFTGMFRGGASCLMYDMICMWAWPIGFLQLCIPTLLSGISLSVTIDYMHEHRNPMVRRIWPICYAPMIVSLYGGAMIMPYIWPQARLETATEWLYHAILFGFVFGALQYCLIVLIGPETKFSTAMRKKLLLADNVKEGIKATRIWVVFFLTTMLTFLWYDFCYDPTNTEKPGWTDRFG